MMEQLFKNRHTNTLEDILKHTQNNKENDNASKDSKIIPVNAKRTGKVHQR